MRYYAKISFLNSGFRRIHAEIWETSHIDETNYDIRILNKKFFKFSSAKKWSEKSLLKSTLSENFSHVFIKDIDLIKRELR
jgi:hypothetical protein